MIAILPRLKKACQRERGLTAEDTENAEVTRRKLLAIGY
jgi:hypothetical protein